MNEAAASDEIRCVCLSPGLGVALSGAGARGVAQIGVLKVLDREGIPMEYVAGTSSGAVIGGLYALTGRADEVERRVLELLHRAERTGRPRLFASVRHLARSGSGGGRSSLERLRRLWLLRRGLSQPSVAPADEILCALEELFEGKTFADTKIPFATTAVDLESGRRLIFASGPLVEAVYASAALPGIVPPLEVDGYRLVDGGFAEPAPVDTCRYLGAGRVIAVDVLGRPPDALRARNALATVLRADQITRFALEREHLAKADVVVTPQVGAVDWMDFSQPEARVAQGERAAEERIDTIRDLIARFEQTFVRGSVVARRCHPREGAGGSAA